MMVSLNLTLIVLAVPVLLLALYLAVLAAASRQARALPPGFPRLQFTFLVPAHDEEKVLARTLESLFAVNWPHNMFRVHVVADNCTDRTADIARRAGASVTERFDAGRRGKGHALAAGFAHCLADPFADAVIVIDADSTVDADFLVAMQAHVESGEQVVQARYGVLNAGAGWRARLMDIALALFHDVRSCGREVLGLSSGLRGNGMCFTREALNRLPPQSTSIVEDVEQGILLGRAGVTVHYALETRVLGEMPRQAAAAGTQRMRWESGRAQLRRRWLATLVAQAWRERSAVLADLALDLAMPPLSSLALIILAGWLAASAVALRGGGPGAWETWSAAALLLLLYVARGVDATGRGWRAWLDLGAAPLFVAWKLALRLRHRGPAALPWVRTARAGERS
ncbi:MAG: glycosyltransferase [Deltaproteobacteria bacterium]|nr:glycosyltransferase [Deltaproteobacteria bacterium]